MTTFFRVYVRLEETPCGLSERLSLPSTDWPDLMQFFLYCAVLLPNKITRVPKNANFTSSTLNIITHTSLLPPWLIAVFETDINYATATHRLTLLTCPPICRLDGEGHRTHQRQILQAQPLNLLSNGFDPL